MYGTGWVGQAPWGHGQAQYNPNYNYQQPQYHQPQREFDQQGQYGGYYGGPPSYAPSSQPAGGNNQGYYGGGNRDQGFEMQPPQRVYPSQQAPEVHGAKK